MNNRLNFCIERSQFPENSEFSFHIRYFSNDIVAARSFSKDNSISMQIKKAGIYHVDSIIKHGTSLSYLNSPYKYYAPEKIYNLYDKSELCLMEKSIEKTHIKMQIECFKAHANSQIHDFIYFPSNKPNLFILCPSAIIRGQFPVPYFYRWSWAADGKFPGNVIVMSDPTFLLDHNLGAGWMVGDKDNDATKNFTIIINTFCKILKIPFRNIIFWGSSAGGFIAMQLCKYFPTSTAVSVNAQTDIYKYNAYKKLYRIGFPGMTDEEINAKYKERLTIFANLDKMKRNHIFMAQNIQDTHHFEDHFKPFISKLLNTPEPKLPQGIWDIPNSGFTTWIYSIPNGHNPETEDMAKLIIKKLGF